MAYQEQVPSEVQWALDNNYHLMRVSKSACVSTNGCFFFCGGKKRFHFVMIAGAE